MYCFSPRWGRAWISLLCKYTQCGPYQVLLLRILIYVSHSYLSKWTFNLVGSNGTSILCNQTFFTKKVFKSRKEEAAEHTVPSHSTVEKPLLILTGIRCLHSTTNTPFTVATPNGANQISHTLERGEKQRPACRRKTAVSPRKQLKLADFWLPSKHVDCKNLPHTKPCCHIKG